MSAHSLEYKLREATGCFVFFPLTHNYNASRVTRKCTDISSYNFISFIPSRGAEVVCNFTKLFTFRIGMHFVYNATIHFHFGGSFFKLNREWTVSVN